MQLEDKNKFVKRRNEKEIIKKANQNKRSKQWIICIPRWFGSKENYFKISKIYPKQKG